MSFDKMRRQYDQSGLARSELAGDPVTQFQRWFDQARQTAPADWCEPNAMVLATADRSGVVSTRVVLLKQIDAGDFIFFTNYHSRKGKQLDENPRASLHFFWPHLERQVRVEGEVCRTDRQRSETYFHSRPRDSQLGAAVSDQSSVLENRKALESAFAQMKSRWEGKEIPLPDAWGGYRLTPVSVEFWQGRPDRLHDRFVYQMADAPGAAVGDWEIQRLAP